MIRVLIVDDDALVRAGLTMMLDGAAGIAVVGEARVGKLRLVYEGVHAHHTQGWRVGVPDTCGAARPASAPSPGVAAIPGHVSCACPVAASLGYGRDPCVCPTVSWDHHPLPVSTTRGSSSSRLRRTLKDVIYDEALVPEGFLYADLP